ncbi:hypothetical protein STEG23_032339 [Scotinomys teguina]
MNSFQTNLKKKKISKEVECEPRSWKGHGKEELETNWEDLTFFFKMECLSQTIVGFIVKVDVGNYCASEDNGENNIKRSHAARSLMELRSLCQLVITIAMIIVSLHSNKTRRQYEDETNYFACEIKRLKIKCCINLSGMSTVTPMSMERGDVTSGWKTACGKKKAGYNPNPNSTCFTQRSLQKCNGENEKRSKDMEKDLSALTETCSEEELSSGESRKNVDVG